MASVIKYFATKKEARAYHASAKRYGREENQATVATYSRTVYVGNIGYCTTDRQIYEFFSRVGPIENVIMGLNRLKLTPCGFCFVVFRHRSSVIAAMNYLNGMILDGCVIRIEVDKGFREGRQYGRGATGGQPQDEIRRDFDRRRPVEKLDEGEGGGGDGGGGDAVGYNFAEFAKDRPRWGDRQHDDRYGRDRDRDRGYRPRGGRGRGGGGGWGRDNRRPPSNYGGGGGGGGGGRDRDREWRDRDRERRRSRSRSPRSRSPEAQPAPPKRDVSPSRSPSPRRRRSRSKSNSDNE